jgi:hypothetical protein
MLPWIRRLGDWLMPETNRLGLKPQALHYSYEKAGLTLRDQPIPWNAEAVVVEAVLRLPPSARRKTDFTLRFSPPAGGVPPGRDPVVAENLRQIENEDRWRITFRLPVPTASTTVELVWRDNVRGSLLLPVLTRDEFLRDLRLQLPTVSVRLGDEHVACQTFVSTQCKGLQAGGMLASNTTSLVPLLDLDLQVEFSSMNGTPQRVPVRLCSSQLAGKQALLTATPPKIPRRIGGWTVRWLLGDQELTTQQVRGIGLPIFQRSLRLSDTRFVVQDQRGTLSVARQVPPLENVARVGPIFWLASGEPGMAGLCPVQVHVQVTGSVRPPILFDQDVLITDGPTVVAPGTLDGADLAQVTGFEIRVKGRSLGVLPLSPAPVATFTSEGGFKPPQEFVWSSAADEELNERLTRLLGGRT